MLQEMQPLPPESACADALSDSNKSKNRDLKLVPMDCHRAYIIHRTKGRTDYINAVYVPSFARKNSYISTQLPLDKTVGDFWNMCIDYHCKAIVFLSDSESTNDMFSFLPKSGDTLKFGKTSISSLNEVTTKDGDSCHLLTVVVSRGDDVGQNVEAAGTPQDDSIYENTTTKCVKVKSDDSGQVTLVQVILPKKQSSQCNALMQARRVVFDLMNEPSSTSDPPPPVVVMSRDGVVHCDQFIAVYNICDMISTQQEVDVFQTVYNIKRAQPHFFTKIASYEDLYKMAETYIEQTSVYNNT
jgi:protein tyrosine phosphatase